LLIPIAGRIAALLTPITRRIAEANDAMPGW
jgi:hypothetical protein